MCHYCSSIIIIGLPPPHSIIRAMAIHKAPEVVGEVVQCCPKHIDEQSKKCMYGIQKILKNYYY